MRVLVTAATAPYLYHLAPLAWALRTAGHEVRAAVPDEVVEAARGSGLAAVGTGDGQDIGGLVRAAREWPAELVVWDQHSVGGGIAARVAGAAHVRVLSGAHQAPDAAGTARLADLAGAHGVACTDDLVFGELTVDPLVDGVGGDRGARRVAVRPVPYDGPAAVPAFLQKKARRPRVLVTGRALADVGELDAEVVAVVDSARLPAGTRMPRHVRLLEPMPVHGLLSFCSAVVHDGDPLIQAAAAVRGVPQQTTGERADRLLDDPAVRAEAERVRAELAERPSPGGLVPRLEGLVR
ncbi:nucleotide disphospho-sugar-binding domain-containing protein [Streptomyces sp. NPDC020875]|uniref:nucleotide disphospho-sugar-binding domain-containing protein n=1 Tax=Streptomyces sp. NPDC020875 TaxID=3154898 RepID=UPI0033C99FB7